MTNHHIHSVIVSYKRLELTQITLAAYLETVTIPHTLTIVDNGSPPAVLDWLRTLDPSIKVIMLGVNRFPGFATNRGWEQAPPEATLLQRLDNDTKLLPGWCDEMVEAFEDPLVGQYGVVGEMDGPWAEMPTWPIGGNSIIRRTLYDEGIRYDEAPWGSKPLAEDQMMTNSVWAAGYTRVFAKITSMEYLGGGDPAYYAEVRAARGLT